MVGIVQRLRRASRSIGQQLLGRGGPARVAMESPRALFAGGRQSRPEQRFARLHPQRRQGQQSKSELVQQRVLRRSLP